MQDFLLNPSDHFEENDVACWSRLVSSPGYRGGLIQAWTASSSSSSSYSSSITMHTDWQLKWEHRFLAPITQLEVSQNSKRLVCATGVKENMLPTWNFSGFRHGVYVVDVETARVTQRLMDGKDVQAVDISNDGQIILALSRPQLHVLKLPYQEYPSVHCRET